MVSGRVVKTLMTDASLPSSLFPIPCTSKRISAPSLRPIQFRCAVFVVSDQSIQSRLFSSRSA
jgi:hypothetical protein